jgi:hypothetical protein
VCRYSFAEYMSALTLVVGITLFTLADKGLPSFNIIGVFLVTLGVIADAVTSNFEEKKFFRALNCSQAEVVFFSSAFGVLFSILTIWTTGELFDAVDHAIVHPGVLSSSLKLSCCGMSRDGGGLQRLSCTPPSSLRWGMVAWCLCCC